MDASRFFYDSFAIDAEQGTISYQYSTDAGQAFSHTLTMVFPPGTSAEVLRPAVFALGMAELIHYWKALLTPEIVVRAGALTPEQVVFWENLYTKGLGEFFYVNQIDFRGLITVSVEEGAPEILATASDASGKRLVPFGGGKDSLVTGAVLADAGKEFTWYTLEPLPFFADAMKQTATSESISIGRDVAKNFAPIVEMVKQGAPNGHVPITATYILSAVVAAKAYGYSDVIVSLERSAEEGNVEYLGHIVNHQYSKTLEFERMVHAYVQEHIDPSIRVFSLLRPLYEIQIVERFAKHPEYFRHFVSCNRGLKTGRWCGECAKCAFMFAALSAFLSPETVTGIFSKNLFEDEALLPLYEELIGKDKSKPFDCVGTYDENLLALYLSGEQYGKAGLPLPPVLKALPIEDGKAHLPLLTEHGPSIAPSEYRLS